MEILHLTSLIICLCKTLVQLTNLLVLEISISNFLLSVILIRVKLQARMLVFVKKVIGIMIWIVELVVIVHVQDVTGLLKMNAFLHSMLPASKENLGPVYSRTSIFNTSEDLIDVASTTTFIRQWSRLSGQKTTSLLTEPPGDSSQGSFGCSGTGPMRTSP